MDHVKVACPPVCLTPCPGLLLSKTKDQNENFGGTPNPHMLFWGGQPGTWTLMNPSGPGPYPEKWFLWEIYHIQGLRAAGFNMVVVLRLIL